jgi:hypothetical protein
MTINPKNTQVWKDGHIQGYKEAMEACGNCKFCYGKGYSTTTATGRTKYKPCECERGKQIAKLIKDVKK